MTYLWALYAREVTRFRKLWMDTVFNPIVSVVLYLVVFGVVLGTQQVGNTNFLAFIYVGLLGMVLVNASFSNPGFALVIAKNLGTIADLQLVPLRPWQIGMAYALAALTRAIVTMIIAVVLTIWFIPGLHLVHPMMLLVSILLSGLLYGMLGVIFGMKAKQFESLTFITTFILQPMIFLAGVFYPISRLPEPWSTVSLFNPLHHTVNLFRYALLNYQDVSPWISLAVVTGLAAILFVLLFVATKRGLRT